MRALVLGATGQIGRYLLPELLQRGVLIEAVSRQPCPDQPGLLWSRLDLYHGGDVRQRPDVVFSAGPLDGLLAWLSRTRHRPGRIVAFSSTSVHSKQHSPDAAERELAARLHKAEAWLQGHCDARGIGWTILRPTLVYGCGLDENLSRVARLAQRWRIVPIPRSASGLRQPVHAQDLALGAWAAANTPSSLGQVYALPGGEALSYREMLRRTVSCLKPRGYLIVLPDGVFKGLFRLLAASRLLPGLGVGMLDRMRENLVFDDRHARSDLAWDPRGFQPGPHCFDTGLAALNAALQHHSGPQDSQSGVAKS